jgi:hypothetical protein
MSRIRLSEKGSRGRPRKAACPRHQPDEANFVVQGGFRESLGRRPLHLVFGTQPLSQPSASMSFDGSIGLADWSQAEVVGPADHHSVEGRYHGLLIQ